MAPQNPRSGAYPMPYPLDWKPISPRRLRGTPEIFAVEQLRAIPGRGAILKAQGTVGQRWVAVTGRVPYKRQLEEYRSRFKGATQETPHDVPEYAGFLVQRGEVTPGSAGKPNWEETVTVCCPSATIEAKFTDWSGTSEEVVDPRFVADSLSSRLPPLADGVWGEDVACPPQIKVVPQTPRPKTQASPESCRRPECGDTAVEFRRSRAVPLSVPWTTGQRLRAR